MGLCWVSVLSVFERGAEVQSPYCTHADWPFDKVVGFVTVGNDDDPLGSAAIVTPTRATADKSAKRTMVVLSMWGLGSGE